MAKKLPAKALARKASAEPAHPLAGYYADKTGGKFLVAAQPTFALFRCKPNWQPLDPDSPIQDDPIAFAAALRMGTFTKTQPTP